MPVKEVSNRNEKGGIKKYTFVGSFLAFCDESIDELDRLRKSYVKEIEEATELQKQAAADKDFETAKFYKTEISKYRKLYKAVCYFLGQYAPGYRGDSPYIDIYEWLPDHFPEILIIEDKLYLF